MKYTITIHSGSRAPADAIQLLSQALGERRGEVRFCVLPRGIDAEWRGEPPSSMERDERTRLGREAVWSIVQETCEGRSDLRADWYAVGPIQ